jgi:hypothetical protein
MVYIVHAEVILGLRLTYLPPAYVASDLNKGRYHLNVIVISNDTILTTQKVSC